MHKSTWSVSWWDATEGMGSNLVTLCEGSACVCVCVLCKEANVFSRGSINRPRAAHRGLSLNHPPPPAVPSPFYVNHPHTEKPLECTGLSPVAQQTLVNAGRSFIDSVEKLLTRIHKELVAVCLLPVFSESLYGAAATRASI